MEGDKEKKEGCEGSSLTFKESRNFPFEKDLRP